MEDNMKKILGFTLAEVMLTLGLLGVVAALTFPALMNNIDKNQWAVGLKTNKSMVERAFAQMISENNQDTLEYTPLWENLTNSKDIIK